MLIGQVRCQNEAIFTTNSESESETRSIMGNTLKVKVNALVKVNNTCYMVYY